MPGPFFDEYYKLSGVTEEEIRVWYVPLKNKPEDQHWKSCEVFGFLHYIVGITLPPHTGMYAPVM